MRGEGLRYLLSDEIWEQGGWESNSTWFLRVQRVQCEFGAPVREIDNAKAKSAGGWWPT